ncbi:MAG: ABC transporter ATP-binding protein [Desulfobacterales bacterium]|jgi:glycerol transport system ATP-binding protein
MGLSLRNVVKTVGRETHLHDISHEFESGSVNVILGRTLAGKTSLLRQMAGLDRPTRGRIFFNDKDVTGVKVRKRSVAMVYQQFINYPSLTVYKNIASPLKIAGHPKAEIDRRVREASRLLHIDNLLDRLPAELSGGQQQRTAIARSLVKDVDLLLLDEPLVNLDYKLREELREDLRHIFAERESIVVYTTTEPAEALMLGGNILIMDEGRLLQTGPTPDVYRRPANLKVAEVFSDPPINFMEGAIKAQEAVLCGDIRLPLTSHLKALAGGTYMFGARSNHLSLSRSSDEDAEATVTVELAEINGSETFVHTHYKGTTLIVQEDGIFKQKIGSRIPLFLNPNQLLAFNQAGQLVAAPD